MTILNIKHRLLAGTVLMGLALIAAAPAATAQQAAQPTASDKTMWSL